MLVGFGRKLLND